MEEDKKYQTQEVNMEPEEPEASEEALIEAEQTEESKDSKEQARVLAARTIFVDKDNLYAERSENAESEDQESEEPENHESTDETDNEESGEDSIKQGEAEVEIESDSEVVSEEDEETEKETEADADAEEEKEKPVELSDEDKEIVERIRLRKIEAEKKRRRQKRRLISSVVLAVVAIVCFILSFTPIFTVDSIEVKGNTHYSAEEIISMGHAVPGKNLIYKADKAVIQKYLEQNPYIKSAEVQRKFPSTIVISVKERTPVMAIKYDDDYLVLDREGILLQKSRTKPKLTIVEGNIIKKIKLSQQLGTTDEVQMHKSVELVQAMADNDLYFVKIDMTDKYSIKAYVYNTLIVKNDYDTLMENIKNGKLHLVLNKLFSESIKRGTITFNEDGTSTFMPGF